MNKTLRSLGTFVLLFLLACNDPTLTFSNDESGNGSEEISEIMVTNTLASTVTTFAGTANGDMAPIRTLAGGTTGLSYTTSVALFNNQIYVSNYAGNSVTVYPVSANGDVTPTRVISGGATGLNQPWGLDVSL